MQAEQRMEVVTSRGDQREKPRTCSAAPAARAARQSSSDPAPPSAHHPPPPLAAPYQNWKRNCSD